MAKTTKKAEPAAKTTEAVESKSAEKAAPKTAKTKTAAKTTKTVKSAVEITPTVKVFVEYQGKQMDMDAILKAVKAAAGKSVKTLEVYVKPEDGAAYYVVNGKDGGKAEL
jgi:CHASE3 domain sensor protein